MAYMMDPLGNVIGEYESEEERRKREEEQAKAIAQKIEVKTYGDGRQVQTTTQQLPPAAGPVSPDTFARMQQVESGNKDFDAQGRPIVSPAGAMFRNQVMPATAAQPGYGIRPAQSQTPEEYNRVGQEYYQAMLKQFGGDERAAAAAYNAGPGRVQQNMAANQGQLNPAQLPRETQGYLGKVFQGAGQAVTNMFPSAQAGTLPPGQTQQAPTITAPVAPQTQSAINPETGETYQQMVPQGGAPVAPTAPVAPGSEPSSMYSLGTGQTGLGLQMPSGSAMNNPAVTGVPMTTTSAINMYQGAQDKPAELMKLRYDENVPQFIRERAGRRAYDLMDQEIKIQEAKDLSVKLAELAKAGDRKAANDIAKVYSSREPSWLRMIMLSYISPQLAGEEAIALGYGNKDMAVQGADGKSYMVTYNAKGSPLSGISADGKQLSQEELINVAAVASPKKSHEMAQTLGSPVTKTIDGKLVNGIQMYDPVTKKMYVQYGDKKDTNPSGWTAATQNLDLQRAKTIQEINLKLQGKTEEEKMAILRNYNQALVGQGKSAIDPSEVGIKAPQIGGGAAPAAAPAAAVPAEGGSQGQQQQRILEGTAAQGGPAAATGAGIGGRPTMSQIQAGAAANKEIITEAAKEVAKSADTQNTLASINKITGLIDSGEHNIGSVLSGTGLLGGGFRGPIAQTIGTQFETNDAKNTTTIMDTVQKLAADGLKVLGSNPSTVDLEFWTKFKPDASSNPAFVKEWIQTRSDDLKRRLGYAEKQIGAGGSAGAAPTAAATKETPVKKLSREDQQAIEWARQNPNDPRAAQIKQRLGL